jgi:hypothetical protein
MVAPNRLSVDRLHHRLKHLELRCWNFAALQGEGTFNFPAPKSRNRVDPVKVDPSLCLPLPPISTGMNSFLRLPLLALRWNATADNLNSETRFLRTLILVTFPINRNKTTGEFPSIVVVFNVFLLLFHCGQRHVFNKFSPHSTTCFQDYFAYRRFVHAESNS